MKMIFCLPKAHHLFILIRLYVKPRSSKCPPLALTHAIRSDVTAELHMHDGKI